MRLLYRCMKAWVVSACMFSSVGCATHPNAPNCEQHHCVAVVDAGSTASRIYVYAYDLTAEQTPIHIEPIYVHKIEPGLAPVAADDVAVDAYVERLMSQVPHEIPVYFYATAGMRLLPSHIQARSYKKITAWFSVHPQWSLKEARTISGEDEALYGWLGLNYHLHRLEDATQPLVGLLEIGGASAQIAFPLQHPEQIDPKDLRQIDVYGRHLTVFTHSFLGLGANEIFAHAQQHGACFPNGYLLANGESALGDANTCQHEMGDLLNQTYQVKTLTHAALTKSTIQDWYTVAAVTGMIGQKPFQLPEHAFTLHELLQQADDKLCHQDQQFLTQAYQGNQFILRNCLVASYFYGLLVHGFEFHEQQTIYYLSDYDASWTVGCIFLI